MLYLEMAPVPIRADLRAAVSRSIAAIATPGGALSGIERVGVAHTARGAPAPGALAGFSRHLYSEPAMVTGDDVREAACESGYPKVVEAIGVVSRLSSIDRLSRVIGTDLEQLPDPHPGRATGEIAPDLRLRRGHVPMPPGPIPVSLDLVPSEAAVFREMFGAFYMTEEEMADPGFRRHPGLDTPQLETVAARISLLNRCFY